LAGNSYLLYPRARILLLLQMPCTVRAGWDGDGPCHARCGLAGSCPTGSNAMHGAGWLRGKKSVCVGALPAHTRACPRDPCTVRACLALALSNPSQAKVPTTHFFLTTIGLYTMAHVTTSSHQGAATPT
jgi:hypothetical protein